MHYNVDGLKNDSSSRYHYKETYPINFNYTNVVIVGNKRIQNIILYYYT